MCYDGGSGLMWSGVDLQESNKKSGMKMGVCVCVSREDDEDEMEAQEID